MKKIIKNTIILCVITLVAGLSLAAVHQITKEAIANAEEQAVLGAYFTVFSDALSLEEEPLSGCVAESPALIKQVVKVTGIDGHMGWALTVTTPNGYDGDITIVMGVTTDGTLTAISVISQSETAGLGAECKDAAFTDQFKGIVGGEVDYTKSQPSADNQIQAISGATTTTSAIVEAVNVGLDYVERTYLAGEETTA